MARATPFADSGRATQKQRVVQLGNEKSPDYFRALDSCLLALVSAYAWKELPQPQLFTAFGLSNLKPRASRPS